MPTPMTREPRRWWIAASALCLLAGLQIAAVPPEVFADPGVCFMECAVEGRFCCCRQLMGLEPVAPHAPEAEADGRLSAPERACRELCATFANKTPGDDVLPVAGARHGGARSTAHDRIARRPAPFRRLDHSDPSTLPRPPPPRRAFLT